MPYSFMDDELFGHVTSTCDLELRNLSTAGNTSGYGADLRAMVFLSQCRRSLLAQLTKQQRLICRSREHCNKGQQKRGPAVQIKSTTHTVAGRSAQSEHR